GGGAGVPGRDDVGLDRVVGGVGRVPGRDGAFVERAQALVGVGGAAVAAAAEHDRALLLHRVVAAGQRPGVEGGQAAGLGVGALERHLGGAVVLEHGGDVCAGEGTLAGVPRRAAAGEQPVFEVGLDPRSAAGASAEPAAGAEVDRVH